MQLSQRGQTVPASPIRKLVPFADHAKARGIGVYHLNIGQPDIETPAAVLETLRHFSSKVISYTHSQGTPAYLDALVDYYHSVGVSLERSQINVTVGGSEAILFAMLAALDPGDEILLPEPFYTNYLGFATMAGLHLRPLTTHGNDGFHLPPDEAILAKLTPRTRAILLCNPNNPTGTVYTRAELERIALIVQKNKLWWLVDEVYREFVFDPEENPLPSVLSIHGLEEQTIVLDSISKRYSMCGARLGCLVSRNKALMDSVLRFSQARLSVPQIEQILAVAACRLPPSIVSSMIQEYRHRRDIVYEGLLQIPGVSVQKPEGAFYVLPRLPVKDAEHFARWLLTEFSSHNETVMVAPAAGFYATPGLGLDEIRIAYVLEAEELRKAMKLLKEAVVAYQSLEARG